MLIFCSIAHQNIQEGNTEIKDNKTVHKVATKAGYGEYYVRQAHKRELRLPCNEKDDIKCDVVKIDFQYEFSKFLEGDFTFAHKISRNKYEAIYANLTPQSEKQ